MRTLFAVVVLLLLGIFPVSAQDTAEAGEFIEDACPFEVPSNVTVNCGWLIVPENRLEDTDATVELAVAIILARSDNPLPDPIIYLEGGPGGSALAGVESWFNTPYGVDRDIILFDQRGTGFSYPSLNCPEVDEEDSVEAAQACAERLLEEGVDLTAYNSRENAADVEALRLALGVEQINVYGISYGTRLALTVMRDHPQGIRSVVLDSVYPPNVDTGYMVTDDTYVLISNMFADCAAQPACADAFPDLEVRFYDALEAILDAPPLVTNLDGDEVELYTGDVIGQLMQQLQSTQLVSAVPASLDAFVNEDYDLYFDLAFNGAGAGMQGFGDGLSLAQELMFELNTDEIAEIEALAADGDADSIAGILGEIFDLTDEELEAAAQGFIEMGETGEFSESAEEVAPPDIDDDSEGMFYSVQCHEEIPFMSLDESQAIADSIDMPDVLRADVQAGTNSEFEACAIWPAGEPDAIENEAVVSDIPTLVLSAQYDAATPPWWGDIAAETLSVSYNYHFPMVGHGVIDGGDCPIGIGLEFMSDPYAEPDASCIADMNTEFYVP